MPQFTPNSTHTATAPITVLPAGLECVVELYLVDNAQQVATVSYGAFTSTGQEQMIPLSMVMPETEATYLVYLDVLSGGEVLAAYQATENVTIAVAEPPPEELNVWLLNVSWQGGPYNPGLTRNVEATAGFLCTIPNTICVFDVVLKSGSTVVYTSPSVSEDISGSGHVAMNFPVVLPDVGPYSAWLRGVVQGDLVLEASLGEIFVEEPLGAAFSYSSAQCYSGPQANPNYCWLGFACTISNPNAMQLTQIVTLYAQNPYSGIRVLESALVSVGPGGSTGYQFEGGNTACQYKSGEIMWLEDEAGGKSSSCHP